MGGSVQTLYALRNLGLLDGAGISVHPLDSTDPGTLNRILREIASFEGIDLAAADGVRKVLEPTMMIGVSMGMTSEEPITHLEWFDGLLRQYQVGDPSQHISVMTLPNSYLDQFARPRGCRMVPIQPDGENHTGGRFSSPTTRVFLRPLALMGVAKALAHNELAAFDGSLVRPVLERIQAFHGLGHCQDRTARLAAVAADPFVRLAATIYRHGRAGRNKVVLATSEEWKGVECWIEQLVEESLGKGGKGFLIFYGERARPEDYRSDVIFLALNDAALPAPDEILRKAGHPVLRLTVPAKDFASVGALFAGWQRLVAAYGLLAGTTYSGQPAVEAYKKYSRDLRIAEGPVPWPEDTAVQAGFGVWTLYYNSVVKLGLIDQASLGDCEDAAEAYAAVVREAFRRFRAKGFTPYLDFTFNGEITPEVRGVLEAARSRIAHEKLHVRAKIRSGPADYHSTEQSETDGPPELVSLRLAALSHEPPLAGAYSDKFLLAQARGTWQAMEDAGRWVLVMTTPRLDPTALRDLNGFFEKACQQLGH
jgi:glucose-6-phosphate isomerase